MSVPQRIIPIMPKAGEEPYRFSTGRLITYKEGENRLPLGRVSPGFCGKDKH